MIKQYKLAEIAVQDILNRDIREEKDVEAVVDEIIGRVRVEGDKALLEYEARFDKAQLESLQVSEAEIAAAMDSLDAEFIATLEQARDNISQFHSQQVPKNFVLTQEGGIVLGQKYTAVERAGLYVPGGTASYPSSVLMNAVPARLAGVKEIVMTTPPNAEGQVAAPILAAAKVAGVNRIFKVGGAQAIAALA